MLAAAGSTAARASAQGALVLPEGVTEIGEEAFAGLDAVSEIVLPDGLATIGPRAFAGSALYTVSVPESVTSIAPDAFEDIPTPLLIKTTADAGAVRFALTHELDFRADTYCRALLIGQCRYPSPHALSGPAKDVAAMKKLLARGYSVTVMENLSVDGILSAISDTFAKADEGDISLIYYSGHGL